MLIKLSGSGVVYVAGLNYFLRPAIHGFTHVLVFPFIVIKRPPFKIEYPRSNETLEESGKRKRAIIGPFKAFMICEKTVHY